jgi:hypothetical protein
MEQEKKALIQDFVQYAVRRLNLKKVPRIQLINHEKFSQENGSLGCYNIHLKKIQVVTYGRLPADIMRTLAHELVHRRQHEMDINAKNDTKEVMNLTTEHAKVFENGIELTEVFSSKFPFNFSKDFKILIKI